MEGPGRRLSVLAKSLRDKITLAKRPGSSEDDQSGNDNGEAVDVQPGVSVAAGDIASTQPESHSHVEPYGLFEFSPRLNQPTLPSLRPDAQCVDIIAIHGLGGSWQTTWTAPNGNGNAVWLRDRLPIVLAQINVRPRILAFGYDSSYVFTSSASDLETCAEDLLTRIRIARQTEEERRAPIIFIAHSLGGLVVKLAINTAHTDDEYHRDVLEKTTGCLFLAVPFHGSDAASWAQLGSQIVSTVSLGIAGNPGLPSALKRNSKDWMKISRDFVQRGKSMTFRSGYETEKMGRSTIVDEASVRNNVPNERVFPVPGSNHRNICKFGDDENGRFGPIGLAVTELVQAALDDLKSTFPIISELPIATPTFYGRNTQLEELSSTLDPSKLGRKGIVLFGIGGSGKTQLALKYVGENKQLYKAVVWINAFTFEQIKQSFTEASHLISKSWPAKDLPNPYAGDNAQSVVLARLKSTLNRNWLLIVDSADDLNSHNLLQLIPDCTHGSIIITSTRREASDIFEPYGFSSMEIDKLDDDSGKGLLLRKARMSNPLQGLDSAMAIVKELGGIPLALEQAGILLRKRVVNFDNFIEEYRSQYNELMGYLPRVGEVQHDKTRSMHTIFTMLYSYIQKESPTAAAILRLLGIIGPSHVPVSILLDIIRLDPPITDVDPEFASCRDTSSSASAFRLHLTLLEDVCLVKTKLVSNEPQELVVLHRAICQWITKASDSHKAQRIISTARALGEALCSGKKTLAWPMGGTDQYSYLSRICLAWIDRIGTLITESIDSCDIQPPNGLFATDYAKIALNFGYIYFCNARYEEAIATLSHTLEYAAFQSGMDGNNSSDTSQLYYCLGFSSFKTGDLVGAREFLEAASRNLNRLMVAELANITNLQRGISNGMITRQRHHTTAVVAARGPKALNTTHSDNSKPIDNVQQVVVGGSQPKDLIAMEDWLHNSVQASLLRWVALGGQETYTRLLLQWPQSSTLLGELLRQVLLSDNGIIVEILVEYGHMTPLHIEGNRGHEYMVRLLLEHIEDIEAQDRLNKTPLHWACSAKNETIVLLLLHNNAKIEAVDQGQQTPLHVACNVGHKETMQLLIDHDANIQATDKLQLTPLHMVCFHGYRDVVQLLLGHNANIEAKACDGNTPMHLACSKGHYDVVQLLLDNNVEIDGTDDGGHTALHVACLEGNHDIVRLLLDNNAEIERVNDRGGTALHFACEKRRHNVVQLLLEYNAEINRIDGYGHTSLHIACLQGCCDIVRLLLEHDAEIDGTDGYGHTPVHFACEKGYHDIVQLLLEYNAEVNNMDGYGHTPLHIACLQGRRDIVGLLLEYDAEIDGTDCYGHTPLRMASQEGYYDIVRLLLEYGAQIDKRDHEGDAPLDVAINCDRRDVVDLLISYGGRERALLTIPEDPEMDGL